MGRAVVLLSNVVFALGLLVCDGAIAQETTVPAGATRQLTGARQISTNGAFTRPMNGIRRGDSGAGTSFGTGVPAATLPIPPGTITNAATLQANQGASDSAKVDLVFSNATLKGNYAFSLTGFDTDGIFFIAGSFVADGNGNITSGLEDANLFAGVFSNISFTGTYSIGSDGRGSAVTTSSLGTSNFRFVVLSNAKAKIIEFDSLAVAAGEIEKQDPSAFSTSAVNGGYSFFFDGVSANGLLAVAGRFTANGAGTISAGVEDINDAGIVNTNITFSGSYNVAANGRGTATLTTSTLGSFQFSFYVVSQSKLKFVALDFVPAVVGDAEKQESTSFSTASLSGPYAFFGDGVDDSGFWLVSVGRFTANGSGGLTEGVSDTNDGGLLDPNVPFTGTYSITTNGRGTATLTEVTGGATSQFAFYMVSPQKAKFVSLDTFAITGGNLEAQQGVPFTTASLSGDYGFVEDGFTVDGAAAISGRLTADGAGTINGTEDENDAGSLASAVAVNGTYSISSNGRGTATLTTIDGTFQVSFYLVSPSKAFIAEMDASATLGGTAEKMVAAPVINPGGAVNGASFAPGAGVTPGSIVSVFGTDLATSTAFAGAVPLPTTLGEATMLFNGSLAVPKFFASSSQVNIQIPWELDGQTQASLTDTVNSATSSQETVSLTTVAPGLFATNQAGSGQGAILISGTGGAVAAPIGTFPGSRPVMAGEFIEIFCTGLGAVTNQPPTGSAASSNPLSNTIMTPTVTIGGVAATLSFSGLAPGFVGLYQVNVAVPAGAPTGNNVPLVLTIGGVTANTVTIAIQ